MLKTDDFLREFPVSLRNDRDAETPLLLDFLSSKAPLSSVLDIGAHASSMYYAPELRKVADCYHGIDILADPETEKIVDTFFVGNANTFEFHQKYDLVICVSTIEHAGVSTYKGNVELEQELLFRRCLKLAKKYVWVSFPVGQKYLYPNELSIITEDLLKIFEGFAKSFKVRQRFLYTQGAQAGHPWHEHALRDVALKVPYMDFIGNQSICVMEIEK